MPVGTYKAILCAMPKAFYQNTTWQQIVVCQMGTGIFFKEELKKQTNKKKIVETADREALGSFMGPWG